MTFDSQRVLYISTTYSKKSQEYTMNSETDNEILLISWIACLARLSL